MLESLEVAGYSLCRLSASRLRGGCVGCFGLGGCSGLSALWWGSEVGVWLVVVLPGCSLGVVTAGIVAD